MRNTIYQISEEKLTKDEYITEDSFETKDVDGLADWFDNADRNEQIKQFPLMEMFSRRGSVLTYLGNDKAKEAWLKAIRDNTPKGEVDAQQLYHLQKAVDTPFTSDWFTLQEYNDYPHKSSELITEMNMFKPGQKFYICGVVDFHW